MGNIVAGIAIVVILGGAIGYIIKAKKSGVHCIGCSAGGSCSGHCGGSGDSNEGSCGCATGGSCTCGDHK